MQKKKLSNKKLNKKCLEILRNLEIFLFINPKHLKDFKTLLKAHLEYSEEAKEFYNYVKKNWLSKNINYYSYYKILKYYEENNNDIIEYFYSTNNIAESLHCKINNFIGKGVTNNIDFIKFIPKIFNMMANKNDVSKRFDIITKNIFDIVKIFKLNDNIKWVELKDFNTNLKKIINKNFDNINNFYKLFEMFSNEINNDYIDNNENSKNENENTISNSIDYNQNEEDNICKDIDINANLYSDINNELSSEENNENISITDNVMSIKEILDFRKEQLNQLFSSEKNLNKIENNKDLIEDSNDDNVKNNDINNDNDNSLLTRIKRKKEGKTFTKLIQKIKSKNIDKNKIYYEEENESDLSVISDDKYNKKSKALKKKIKNYKKRKTYPKNG